MLLGRELDQTVQEYIENTRKAGGVINTAIVMADATGVVAAKNPELLLEHGGHVQITKAWVKSILKRMGYVKRKCSNAGKISFDGFEEIKKEFLSDIKAEVLINDIPKDLIINWDQTGLHLVPTGEWTMHRFKEKIVTIAHSDDKRQITAAVLAASIAGDYLATTTYLQG